VYLLIGEKRKLSLEGMRQTSMRVRKKPDESDPKADVF
jgi:hypothetical protein